MRRRKLYATKPKTGAPLNSSHPLASGLIGCWLFNEGGGNKVKDLVSGGDATWAGTGGHWYNSNTWGPGGKFNGSDDGVSQDLARSVFNSTNWTVVAGIIRLGTSGGGTGGNPIVGHGPAANTAGHYYFYVNDATSKLAVDIPFVAAAVVTSSTSIATGIPYNVAARKSGQAYNIYLNGKSNSSASSAASPTATGKIYIGTYENNPFFNGHINYLFIYNRALCETEIRLLHANPFAFIRRPNPKSIFQPTSSPTGTLTATFGAMTSAVTGVVDATGTIARTFANMTSTVSGTETITGTEVSTLGNMTSTISGKVDAVGTLAATLRAMTSTATGTETITGTEAATFASMASAIVGRVDATGTLAATLSGMTVSASGTVTATGVTGAAALNFASMTGTGTAVETITGALAATFGAMTSSASATETIAGALAAQFGGVSMAASGVIPAAGALAATFGGMTSAISAAETVTGTMTAVFGDMKTFGILDIPTVFYRQAIYEITNNRLAEFAIAGFLEKEDGSGNILLEDGAKIVLTPAEAPSPALYDIAIAANAEFDYTTEKLALYDARNERKLVA